MSDFDPSTAKPVDSFDPSTATPVEEKQSEIKRIGSDSLISLKKGLVSVPEAAVGILDIPTKGAIGKLAEQELGFAPQKTKQNLEQGYSPELKADLQAVRSAEGFIPTVKEAVTHPATIGHSIVESIPGTLAGAGVGRLAAGAGLGARAAAGVGEGVVSAGQNVEQIRQDSPDGTLTAKQALLGAGSGAVTGAIGAGSASVANKLGLRDVDELLINGAKSEVRKGLIPRVATGAATEGLLEELPQSAQEQAMQNLAEDKPIGEGVGNAAAMGALTGAGMGGAVNLPGPLTRASAIREAEQPMMPFKSKEAAQARANAMMSSTGQAYEVMQHPTVGGAFAVTPVEAQNGAAATGTQTGMGANVRPDHDGATQADDGTRLGDTGGTGTVEHGSPAGREGAGDQPQPGLIGAGLDERPNPVNPTAGPIERAAALAPRQTLPRAPFGALQDDIANPTSEPQGFSNVGADKVTGLRMESPIDEAAHQAASSPMNGRSDPTDPQKDANNTKLGWTKFQGLPLRIENPQGSVRESKADAETPWRSLMTEHYGYIAGTKGADGDKVDAFVGAAIDSPKAFVIDQTNPDGSFDEHKIMLGFNSLEEAKAAYYDNYQAGWKGGESIHETTVDGLKDWLKNGDTKAPFMLSPSASGAATPNVPQSLPADASVAPSPTGSPSAVTVAQSAAPQSDPLSPAPAATSRLVENLQQSKAAMPTDVDVASSLASPNKGVNPQEDTRVSSLESGKADESSTNIIEKLNQQAAQLQERIKQQKPETPLRMRMEAQVDEIKSRIANVQQRQRAVADQVIPASAAQEIPTFSNKLEAARFARSNKIDAEPVAMQDGSVALQPKAAPLSLTERKGANAAVAALNESLRGDHVTAKVAQRMTPLQAAVRSVVQRAFGVKMHYVEDNPVFNGVMHNGNVFISTGEKNPLVATTFHEVMHVMQTSEPDVADRLHNYLRLYMNGGLVEGRIAQEHEAAKKAAPAGEEPQRLSFEEGEMEAVADINGAAALDPEFWRKMAHYDASLFRKVAYKFMELLTKAIEVARGSHFDIDRMVKDRDAVEHLIAAAWAEYNQKRDGNKKAFAEPEPAFSRKNPEPGKVTFEVVSDPRKKELKAKWDAMPQESKMALSIDLAKEIVPRALKELGLKGELHTQFGGWKDDTNPSLSIWLDGGDATAISKLTRVIGSALSQEAMMRTSDTSFEGSFESGAIVVKLPKALNAVEVQALWSKIRQIKDASGEPRIMGHSTNDEAMIMLVDTEGVEELAQAVEKAVGDEYEVWVDSIHAAFPEKGEDDYGLHGTREDQGHRAEPSLRALASELRAVVDGRLAQELGGKRGDQKPNAGRAEERVRHSRRSLSDIRAGASVAVREQRPDAAEPVVGLHYGKHPNLSTLAGSRNGTGIAGREQERLRYSKDARIKQRVYLYNDLGGTRLPPPEPGLGPHLYAAKLGNLYDLKKDPAGVYPAVRDIRDQADRLNALESKIVDAGYDGYSNGDMIVVLGGNVPVNYLGDKLTERIQFSRKQTDTPEFKKWFGNSKVVDSNGKPLVVYHGTEADTATLSSSVNWGSESADLANAYAKANRVTDGRPSVMPLFIAINNPVRVGPVGNKKTLQEFATLIGFDFTPAAYADGSQHSVYRMVNTPEFVAAAKAAGYDGVFGYEAGRKTWGAFDPNQIKSATGNNGAFDSGNADIRFSRKPVFYSALQRAVTSSMPHDKQGMISPAQAKMWLAAKAKEGKLKSAEVEWSGITNWLDMQQGKVPVADIESYLSQNGVRVQEVMKGGSGKPEWKGKHGNELYSSGGEYIGLMEDAGDTFGFVFADGGYFDTGANRMDKAIEAVEQRVGKTASHRELTEYDSYVLPGGENYRELLLTLPVKPVDTSGWTVKSGDGDLASGTIWEVRDANGKWVIGFPKATLRQDEAIKKAAEKYRSTGYKSPHWKEKNILAHIRFDDRADANGNKVLFIEELQSDWGQEGKKNGFKDATTASKLSSMVARYDELNRERRRVLKASMDMEEQGGPGQEFIALEDKERALKDQMDAMQEEMDSLRSAINNGAPAAPFVTKTESWVALAIKRMIRYAAENGYDKIAFVNGQQSADRYDLSNQVDSITYEKTDKGFFINVMSDGRNMLSKNMTPQEVEDHVGKEILAKMQNKEGVHEGGRDPDLKGSYTLRGLDLKVGGEGMKAFYDKIVPNVVNDVLKKIGGGKVGSVGEFVYKRMLVQKHGDGWVIFDTKNQDYYRGGDSGRPWVEYPQNAKVYLSERTAQKSANEFNGSTDSGEQLGFEITPQMRATVMEGQPLFSRKPPAWINQVPGMTPQIAAKVGAWVPHQTYQQRWATLKQDFGKKVVQGVFDQFAPIKEVSMHAYMLARMSKSYDGGVEAMLMFGKPKLDGSGALTVDRSGGFTSLMAKLQGEQDRFFSWVAGNRAAQLKAQGRENLLDLPEIAALQAANQGRMADGSSRAMLYAQVNRELQVFNNAILDIAEQTGVIDPAARAIWKNDFYVPFYRLQEDGEGFAPVNVSGLTNAKGIKRLKGGKENLGDLMQNTVLNWAHLLSSSLKNQAATFTLREAEQIGAAHQIADAQKGSVFILDNGKKVHFMVDDPYLLNAVSSIAFTGIKGVVIDAASLAKRALSFGVTFSPSYRLRNLIRDQLQAVAANPMSFNVGKNLVEGIKASSKNNPLYAQMLAGGGLFRMGAAYEENRAMHLKRQIAKLDPATVLDTQAKVKDLLGKAFDAYMETGERAEAATRATIYSEAIADGKSHLEASFLARDSMDFGLQGTWQAVRLLSQTVPFFNARVQGMYKLGRAMKEDPRRFSIVLGATTAATIALMLANHDDEDWKKREEWDRDNFWWFKAGGIAYRIPKPFEIGAISSIAERGLEMVMDGMSEQSAKRFGKRVLAILGDNLSMNVTPQLIKPVVDVYSNRDPFRNRPIETMGDERLSPRERIGANTTALAQALGQTNVLSPKQIDYLITGYFGWLGSHLAMASDALRPVFGMPDKPTRALSDMFVIGDWVKELPARDSRFVSEFYDQANEVRQAVGDINHYKKLSDVEKVKSLVEENKSLLQKRSAFNLAGNNINKINARLRQIEASSTMSAEQKRQEIDRLTAIRNKAAESVVNR